MPLSKTEPPESPTTDMPSNTIHDILRNERRRSVLRILGRTAGPMDVRSLAERIAEVESGQAPAPSKIRKSVYNALVQTHIPKLAREGVVEYDPDRKILRPRGSARNLGRHLDVSTPNGWLWSTFYRTLATVSLSLVLLSLLEVPLVSAVDPLLWTVLGLGVIAISTTYQLWRLRWLYLPLLRVPNAD